MGSEEISIKEERIRKITKLYYSRPDVQKAMFNFSEDREVVPSFMMESFGKRPDTMQYPGDIFELVKKGATSFHCSQELWKDPLKIKTGMSEEDANELRKGWDLLFDIDSKYLDYSKILVEIILDFLKFHGVKNVGIKFSGSKGFHIILPWKSFPKSIGGIKTKDMFPQWPRIITQYMTANTQDKLIKKITELTKPNKYVRDFKASKEVMPDLILVSSRHLFRMPYSLHEKTALASVVLDIEQVKNFDLKNADPMNVVVRDFNPNSKNEEAKELLMQALDWYRENNPEEEKISKQDYIPIKIQNLSEKNFPPSIIKIMNGLKDGRKRGLFILLNFLRSIGMERNEVELQLEKWNKKNEIPLKKGYIKSQIIWAYRNKIIPPPNFSKDYYKGIGIIPNEEEMRYKNPSNYFIKKSLFTQNQSKKKVKKKNK